MLITRGLRQTKERVDSAMEGVRAAAQQSVGAVTLVAVGLSVLIVSALAALLFVAYCRQGCVCGVR